jgi:hypothetical protein
MSNNSKIMNNYIENQIKSNKIFKYIDKNDIDLNNENLDDAIELQKLEKELDEKSNIIYPKNHGNLWSDEERLIILNYLKKNNYSNNIINYNSNLYDEKIIQKIAKKTERSEYGIKEEIKKMIFNDYINVYDTLSKISKKYCIPEHNIKILIRIYLEKNGKKIIFPLEMENNILKLQVENIKLKKELKELLNNVK